jgi:hypothetical protein
MESLFALNESLIVIENFTKNLPGFKGVEGLFYKGKVMQVMSTQLRR